MSLRAERSTLRVGYFRESLPFAFTNTNGDLVGFDIELAHILAQELGGTLEFVRIEREQVAGHLYAGHCDLVMSGFTVTTDRAQQMAFSTSTLVGHSGCLALGRVTSGLDAGHTLPLV